MNINDKSKEDIQLENDANFNQIKGYAESISFTPIRLTCVEMLTTYEELFEELKIGDVSLVKHIASLFSLTDVMQASLENSISDIEMSNSLTKLGVFFIGLKTAIDKTNTDIFSKYIRIVRESMYNLHNNLLSYSISDKDMDIQDIANIEDQCVYMMESTGYFHADYYMFEYKLITYINSLLVREEEALSNEKVIQNGFKVENIQTKGKGTYNQTLFGRVYANDIIDKKEF